MARLYIALLTFAAAGTLAGCGNSSTATNNGATVAMDVPVATPAHASLTPQGAPRRADGFWEMASFAEDGSPMAKQSLCVGAGSEDKFSVFDQLTVMGNCSKQDFRRTSTGWTFETRCELMGVVAVQKGTISGDFQHGFLVDQTVSQATEIPRKGLIRGTRVGACPAKYKPGDLIDKGGDVLGNMLSH
jgi:hypothetical protein